MDDLPDRYKVRQRDLKVDSKDLYRGFESGIIDWDVISMLGYAEDLRHPVSLTKIVPASGGVWFWLNQQRFFFSYAADAKPPLKTRLVGVAVGRTSVTLLFEKRRKRYSWNGDALRVTPLETLR